MKEFRINDYISLKLEGGKTNLYVKGELFDQCKFLLIDIPIESDSSFEDIDSIDKAAEQLDKSLEPHIEINKQIRHNYQIPPDVEFWGHCSNLQVWYENCYDTRLLHRNMAFPLLKKLTDVGDPLALKVFKEEIILRYLKGIEAVKEYLYVEDYFSYLNSEEIISGILKPDEVNTLIELNLISKKKYKFVRDFDEDKVRKERFFLENLYFSSIDGFVTELELNLNYFNFQVPEILSRLRSLFRLVIYSGSKSDRILRFKAVDSVKDLTLTLNGNVIIPDNFEKFKNLQSLSIYGSGDTKFEKIPSSLGQLSKLEELDIRNVPMEQFPYALTKLKSLEVLILLQCSCTKIKEIPDIISEIPSLKSIKIEDIGEDD